MQALQAAGWRTGAFGKLHLRSQYESLFPDYRPYGFDVQHVTEDARGGPWLEWIRTTHPRAPGRRAEHGVGAQLSRIQVPRAGGRGSGRAIPVHSRALWRVRAAVSRGDFANQLDHGTRGGLHPRHGSGPIPLRSRELRSAARSLRAAARLPGPRRRRPLTRAAARRVGGRPVYAADIPGHGRTGHAHARSGAATGGTTSPTCATWTVSWAFWRRPWRKPGVSTTRSSSSSPTTAICSTTMG